MTKEAHTVTRHISNRSTENGRHHYHLRTYDRQIVWNDSAPGGEDEDGTPFEKKGRDLQPTMTDGLGPLYWGPLMNGLDNPAPWGSEAPDRGNDDAGIIGLIITVCPGNTSRISKFWSLNMAINKEGTLLRTSNDCYSVCFDFVGIRNTEVDKNNWIIKGTKDIG